MGRSGAPSEQGSVAPHGAERLPHVDVQSRLDGDRLQMLDRVDRAADGEHRAHGVADRAVGDDRPGPDVALDEVDDRCGRPRHRVPHALAVRPDRCRTRHRHPDRFGHHVHRVRRRQTRAHTGTEDRVVGELFEVIGRLARDGSLRRQQEDLFDVRFAALGEPGVLVAARDDDGRDVEAPGRHQVRGGRLVARAEADHAVELRALHAASMSFTIRSRLGRM